MNPKRIFSFLSAALLAGLALLLFWGVARDGRAAPANADPAQIPALAGAPPLNLVSGDGRGLLLDFSLPDFEIETVQSGAGICQRLTLPGFASAGLPGAPALPVTGALVGLPLDAAPRLEVLQAETVAIPQGAPLCPVASPVFEDRFLDDPAAADWRLERDEQSYQTNQFLPAQPVELVADGFIRSQRVAQLRFQPFQYNPAAGELRYFSHLRLRLHFDASPGPASGSGFTDEGIFEPLLAASLINYEQARPWRTRPEQSSLSGQPAAVWGDPAYKVLIDQPGIYRLSYADLETAGLPVGLIDPGTFQLFNQGRAIALRVVGQSDGSFDPGDSLQFYGEAIDTKYSGVNVYWLTWGNVAGLRMVELAGTPDGSAPVLASFMNQERLEKNLIYVSNHPSGADQDVWYWDYLNTTTPDTPVSKNFVAPLDHISTLPLTVTVRGLFKGYSATPQHHTRVFLNGHLIDDATWQPQAEYFFEVQAPQSYLLEGDNTISVQLPMDGGITQELVLFNWFEIDYADSYIAAGDQLFFSGDAAGEWEFRLDGFSMDSISIFDISDPLAPALITGATSQWTGSAYRHSFQQTLADRHRYLALSAANERSPLQIVRDSPSNWHSLQNGADYLIITHRDFYTTMLALSDYRADQGLRTALVDVQDLYDEFNGGVTDPQAIHDFLAYAYAHWQPPAPAYALLVGDGNFDPRNYLSRNTPHFIPPNLAQADPWLGEVPADNRLVAISGEDVFPDMHLGRLPVRTAQQAAELVAKIIAYEQSPDPADWNSQVLFVADNADTAGNFADYSDVIVNGYLPLPYAASKIYWKVTHSDITQARAEILNQINQGRLIVNYVGHGGVQFWASEFLLQLSSIASINNPGRLPLFVPMTCLEGSYQYLDYLGSETLSLAEGLLRAPNKGAIASFSPTGFGVAQGHDFLNRGLFEAVFTEDIIQLGPATTYAKYFLYANSGGEHLDLLDTYLLFGDPALRLNVLPADLGLTKSVEPVGAVYPGDTIRYTLTYSNAGPATAHHVVIRDALPSGLTDVQVTSSGAPITLRDGTHFVWDVADLAMGQGGQIVITARVALDFSGEISNTAGIETSARQLELADNTTAPVTTTVLPLPDLAISKTAPANLAAGQVITYVIAFANVGAGFASGVTLTDDLPDLLLDPQVAATRGAAITARPGEPFTWDVEALSPGEGGVITLTAQLPADFTGLIENSAEIATLSLELNTANNATGPVVTGVNVPDLAISKTAPANLAAGETIVYRISFANQGFAGAQGVVLTDLLPAQLLDPQVAAASGAAITPRPGAPFVWDVEDLASGAGGVITLTAMVDPSFSGLLTNTASIATAIAEPNLANNSAGPVVTGVSVPDLAISKHAPAQLWAGGEILYTLIFTNVGSAVASGVVISDVLPAELQGVQITSSGAAISARPGTHYLWDVANLSPGEGGRIEMRATVDPAFANRLTNSAAIAFEGVDPHPENNRAIVATWLRRDLVYLPVFFR